MKIFIQKEYFAQINYIWKIFEKNKGFSSIRVDSPIDSDISITDSSEATLQVSKFFFNQISHNNFDYNLFFTNEYFVRNENGSKDLLSTAFYMINGLQEFDSRNMDEYGRLPFTASYQHKFNCSNINIVQNCFDELCQNIPQLNKYNKEGERSRVFLSHDIDTIHGSLLQDSFYALKKGRIDWIAQIILKNIFIDPQWLNIDRIMKIENEYDFKSTFFWLVNKGNAGNGFSNSDYQIQSNKVLNAILSVEKKGWGNGIHKSISNESFQTEINKLPI
jgi:hypothetical protein